MKSYSMNLLVVFMLGGTVGAYADVIINEPAPATSPNPAPQAAVVVPAPTPAAVAVPAPVVVVPDLDREGDRYIVAGTADVDRYHNILRVKDDKHGWVSIAYRDGVDIYRNGRHISFMDVNPGDNVTVRFKSS